MRGLAAELAAAGRRGRGTGVPGCAADVGAGPGYYLAAVLGQLPGRAGLALDVSKFALRRAARAHPRIGAVAADAWRRLPVADGAAAVVVNVFAPRSGPSCAASSAREAGCWSSPPAPGTWASWPGRSAC